MGKEESLEYVRDLLYKRKKRNAKERYSQLRILGLAKGQKLFFGSHPELDEIIQEIFDDAVKHGIIDQLPEGKRIWISAEE